MGVRKLKAISLFLEHATGEMFEAIVKHLQHHSWTSCALSDALLASPLIDPELTTDDEPGATTSDSANESRYAPPGHSHGTIGALVAANHEAGQRLDAEDHPELRGGDQ